MQVKYEFENGTLKLYLIGELDEHYAKGVKEYIDGLVDGKSGIRKIVFNLSELTFMDSTGIGMLLGRYKRLKKMNLPSFIENPVYNVEKVLELSGIYEVMPKM